jgi:uridine monophosphate synthetase
MLSYLSIFIKNINERFNMQFAYTRLTLFSLLVLMSVMHAQDVQKQVQMPTSNGEVISKEALIEELFAIGSVKFGEFTLKVTNGYITTPIYIDLRLIQSHPQLFKKVVDLIINRTQSISYDIIAGVPNAAICYASGMVVPCNKPMIMPRKEVKGHGTKSAIEGSYKPGQSALLIEDVIVSAASVLSAMDTLEDANLLVKDVIVICDREQGGRSKIEARGARAHILFTLSELLNILYEKRKIDAGTLGRVKKYIAENQCS